ncbi:MAG: putative phage abortive infection protein [Sterolibacteriaceae bacterium MAG5]|nr:putative phage abortive infection protein [Candidatus Nitricoxidireducens bremensis]
MTTSPVDKEIEEAGELFSRLKWLALVGIVVATIIIGAYLVKFSGSLSDSREEWGQFGDYVGGLLNPTFSFLALLAFLGTFALQVRELRISAKELKNSADALVKQNEALRVQNFEASFFQLLRLHNDIVSSIDIVSRSGKVTKGRDCFKVFLNRLQSTLEAEGADGNYEAFLIYYDLFYIEHQHEIGHYFRLMYNIIKLVSRTGGIDKRFYTNLVRAQLSSAELMLLFYNCLSSWGSEKFKPMVEEFALLKTMPNTSLPKDELLHQYSPAAFGGKYPEPLL